MARVEIVIEELVLHGFAPADAARIGDAVQGELARLLGEQGLTVAGHEITVGRLDAGSFQLTAPAAPPAIGAGIARSLHSGIQGAVHG